MDKNSDFNNFDVGYGDPIMNPMMQYEQGYMYYKYLSQQLDYKIKCIEYENLCNTNTRTDRNRVS